ncbi:MAG: DUF3990 domain-containing protein [Solobacterium sp.]|nr:DUF3990 domain-containing protein [Solobacterium sp.]
MSVMKLFHTGYEVIERPDIRIGRKNADLGQGFYLSDNEEFSRRWARQKRGYTTYLNQYELETEGLKIKRFEKDEEWFEYIFRNRMNAPDSLAEYDVLIGPIANDTIYDTFGILTSGLMKTEDALAVLRLGNTYYQIVLKTQKAADALRFIRADVLEPEEIASYREIVQAEEKQFQEEFAKLFEEIGDPDD